MTEDEKIMHEAREGAKIIEKRILDDKLNKIIEIGARAHGDQTRRDGSHYFAHPKRVAERVNGFTRKAAAILHDVLEDTEEDYASLLKKVEEVVPGEGIRIVSIVQALTHDKEYETYLEYLERVKVHSPDAVKVKVADIMDNLNDNPTPVEMVKYPAALIYLSGLGEETPEKILEILEAGKALKDKK